MSLTPEQLAELWNWYQARRVQQLVAPVDDVSKAVLGAPLYNGAGSVALTQSIGAVPANVPAAYRGTVILVIEGVPYAIPYL